MLVRVSACVAIVFLLINRGLAAGEKIGECHFCRHFAKTGLTPYEILWTLSEEIGSNQFCQVSETEMLLDPEYIETAESAFYDYCTCNCLLDLEGKRRRRRKMTARTLGRSGAPREPMPGPGSAPWRPMSNPKATTKGSKTSPNRLLGGSILNLKATTDGSKMKTTTERFKTNPNKPPGKLKSSLKATTDGSKLNPNGSPGKNLKSENHKKNDKFQKVQFQSKAPFFPRPFARSEYLTDSDINSKSAKQMNASNDSSNPTENTPTNTTVAMKSETNTPIKTDKPQTTTEGNNPPPTDVRNRKNRTTTSTTSITTSTTSTIIRTTNSTNSTDTASDTTEDYDYYDYYYDFYNYFGNFFTNRNDRSGVSGRMHKPKRGKAKAETFNLDIPGAPHTFRKTLGSDKFPKHSRKKKKPAGFQFHSLRRHSSGKKKASAQDNYPAKKSARLSSYLIE